MAALADGLVDYARRRLAGRIAALPDGTYRHTVWMDDDGLGGAPAPIAAAVTVTVKNSVTESVNDNRKRISSLVVPSTGDADGAASWAPGRTWVINS